MANFAVKTFTNSRSVRVSVPEGHLQNDIIDLLEEFAVSGHNGAGRIEETTWDKNETAILMFRFDNSIVAKEFADEVSSFRLYNLKNLVEQNKSWNK